MLQVARLAPNLLSDAAPRVAEFLRGELAGDGGAKNRAGESDLYYTAFLLDGLVALREELPRERVRPYLAGFGDGEALDQVHRACLVRCWAALGEGWPSERFAAAACAAFEACRSADGGYARRPGARHGTLYDAFLALGVYQDLGLALPAPEALARSFAHLRAGDGAYANALDLAWGTTPSTAAAAAVLVQLAQPVPGEVGPWLLSQTHARGGFKAMPEAPLPDLLSTATALHALAALGVSIGERREAALDFLDSLWSGARLLWPLGGRRAGLRVRVLRAARPGPPVDRMSSLGRTLENARARLLEQRVSAGHWVGELSTSALSTATACLALARVARELPDEASGLAPLLEGGRRWLARHANPDGGFGDTVESPSNLSTSVLAWTALAGDPDTAGAREAAGRWLERRIGALEPERLVAALEEVYGADRTFAVPILAACALSGAFGPDGAALWRAVPALPFELAALPQPLFRWLGLPVVSYALPALIAIGQAIEHHRPSRNPLARAARRVTRARTLAVLERIQPSNGGFLEATPLTSFVVFALAATGRAASPTARRGARFLVESVRPDGSWPIDTNLATWVTTLAVNALGASLEPGARPSLARWLLAQQHRVRHPATGAAPGGWAWTDLPGGVPDADDTAGALLALRALGERSEVRERGALREPEDESGPDERSRAAARAGVRWLCDLQNRDGGIPTFCRGWGKLPFDRSTSDLTAHALRAIAAWRAELPPDLRARADRTHRRALAHLVAAQRADGAWVPLWFGNQRDLAQENPVYGTSRVLRAAGALLAGGPGAREACGRGLAWLLAAQASDGGFGGAPGLPPSVEETALALEALADVALAGSRSGPLARAIARAAEWLASATEEGTRFDDPAPIGLYFAKLWYWERLYGIVFTVSALERARGVPWG